MIYRVQDFGGGLKQERRKRHDIRAAGGLLREAETAHEISRMSWTRT